MNELEKIFNKIPVKSYKEKVKTIEDALIDMANGDDIIGNGKEVIYPEHMWEYKHTFADGVYIREMNMKAGQLVFSAIHKHKYALFLLTGSCLVSTESGIEEYMSPCYVVSSRGVKRVLYAIEDCKIVTTHANPTNTKDLNELAEMNVVFNWDEYNEYIKDENEKN
jgi:hypothetical protein